MCFFRNISHANYQQRRSAWRSWALLLSTVQFLAPFKYSPCGTRIIRCVNTIVLGSSAHTSKLRWQAKKLVVSFGLEPVACIPDNTVVQVFPWCGRTKNLSISLSMIETHQHGLSSQRTELNFIWLSFRSIVQVTVSISSQIGVVASRFFGVKQSNPFSSHQSKVTMVANAHKDGISSHIAFAKDRIFNRKRSFEVCKRQPVGQICLPGGSCKTYIWVFVMCQNWLNCNTVITTVAHLALRKNWVIPDGISLQAQHTSLPATT